MAAASVPPVSVSAGALTVRLRLAVAVCTGVALSLADSLIAAAPALVGVPLMVSVAPAAVEFSPAGRPVTVHL